MVLTLLVCDSQGVMWIHLTKDSRVDSDEMHLPLTLGNCLQILVLIGIVHEDASNDVQEC